MKDQTAAGISRLEGLVNAPGGRGDPRERGCVGRLKALDGGNPVTQMGRDADTATPSFGISAGLVTKMKGVSIPMGRRPPEHLRSMAIRTLRGFKGAPDDRRRPAEA